MMGQGTREQFNAWLTEKKHLTHTAYSRLAVPAKAAVYAEYRKSQRKGGTTDGESKKD
jgi:hypothetical protein